MAMLYKHGTNLDEGLLEMVDEQLAARRLAVVVVAKHTAQSTDSFIMSDHERYQDDWHLAKVGICV